jgi:hypothetical protein
MPKAVRLAPFPTPSPASPTTAPAGGTAPAPAVAGPVTALDGGGPWDISGEANLHRCTLGA